LSVCFRPKADIDPPVRLTLAIANAGVHDLKSQPIDNYYNSLNKNDYL